MDHYMDQLIIAKSDAADDFGAATIYFIAVACSAAGSFCTSSGLILMKIANLKVEKMKNSNAKFYCQLEWLMGLLVIICGLFFNACKSTTFYFAVNFD